MASPWKVHTLERLVRGAVTPRTWRPARIPLEPVARASIAGGRSRSDADHLAAAARWLAAAQDATSDGGIASHFTLGKGWGASYPETTGYIVPTFLRLAREPGMGAFEDRAATAIEFLLRLQLPDGAFPAGQVDTNTTIPSVFNTAQVLCGLIAWHRHTGEQRVLDSAMRAGNWLVSTQDADGSWKRHVYHDLVTSYTAYASCWLAELGAHTADRRYSESAGRHLEWLNSLVDVETGWFDRCGFTHRQHKARIAVTHTIAYTLAGVLMTSELLGNAKGIANVEQAAGEIANRMERLGWLPGMLDWRWHRRSSYACVTGTVQMASIWMRLFERDGELRWKNAAELAIDVAKRAQEMHPSPVELHGAIPGSDPIWGSYMRFRYPNWAAKFFIDALFEKRHLEELASSEAGHPATRERGTAVRGGDVSERDAHSAARAMTDDRRAPQVGTFPRNEDYGSERGLVTFFPDWRGDRYINSLLSALASEGWAYEIVGRRGLWFALIDAARGRGTVHLHWFEGFNPRRRKLDGLVAWFYLPTLWLAGRRGRLVWTVHNVIPHEGYAPFIGPAFLRRLARSASRMLVHFDETREAVQKQYGVTDKVFVTHPASYGHAYGPPIERSTARASVWEGITDANTLFVQMGSLRSYKRPDMTVAAFRECAPPSARLLIAGPTSDASVKAAIIQAAGQDPRIRLRFERLPEEDLVAVLCAADWSICPYASIDNPGALNLSVSYDCPVIAPSIPQVNKLTAGHPSILYPPVEPARQFLAEAIARAAEQRRDPQATRAQRSGTHRDLARRTIEQYSSAIGRTA